MLTRPFEEPRRPRCQFDPTFEKRIKNGSTSLPYPEYASARCCDDVLGGWSTASSDFVGQQSQSFFTTWLETVTKTKSWTIASCDGPFTTLCDGIPRAVCSPSTPQSMLVISTVSYVTSSQTATREVTSFSIPYSTCTLNREECARLWNDYVTSKATYDKALGMFDYLESNRVTQSTFRPLPKMPACLYSEFGPCMGSCNFNPDEVQVEVLLWNREVDGSHLCPTKNLTANPPLVSSRLEFNTTATPPPITRGPGTSMTAMWGKSTLISPTLYVFFSKMRFPGCGSPHSSILIPLDPTELSIFPPEGLPTRVNLDDFAYKTVGPGLSFPLVPSVAYVHDHRCTYIPGECRTMYHDFQPAIIFRIGPEVLSSIDPAWRHCGYQQFLHYDPPRILQATTAYEIQPTLRSPGTTGLSGNPEVMQSAPMPMRTGSMQLNCPAESLACNRETGSMPISNDDSPGVLVTVISLFTIYATSVSVGSRAAPGQTVNQVEASTGSRSLQTMSQVVFVLSRRPYTAIQVLPGTFVLGGFTISAGGTPARINGAEVSAFGSGVIITNGGQATSTTLNGSEIEHSATFKTGVKKNQARTCPSWSRGRSFLVFLVSLLVYNPQY